MNARILLIGATATVILTSAPFAHTESAPAQKACSWNSKKQCAEAGGTTASRGTARTSRQQPKIEEAPRPGIPIGEEELRRLKSLPGKPPPNSEAYSP
jgi:hypothetical protein